MRNLLSLWLVVMLLTACGRTAAKASPTPGSPGTATHAPVHITTLPATANATANAAATAAAGSTVVPAARPTAGAPVVVTITASDGKKLSADYYPPVVITRVAGQKAPGVLFLHMVGGSRADWAALARQLQAEGIASLALDFRGQGASAGPEDWNKSVDDTRAAWETLLSMPEVDSQRTAIVGASIGANLALIVGANNAKVATVVALSPGDDFQGVRPTGLLSNFGNRPVYLIASQDDSYSYSSVGHMAPHLAAGETFFYTNAGHGTAMFSNPDLATRVLAWLGVHIGDAKG
jgi:dienelactone hydrolase